MEGNRLITLHRPAGDVQSSATGQARPSRYEDLPTWAIRQDVSVTETEIAEAHTFREIRRYEARIDGLEDMQNGAGWRLTGEDGRKGVVVKVQEKRGRYPTHIFIFAEMGR